MKCIIIFDELSGNGAFNSFVRALLSNGSSLFLAFFILRFDMEILFNGLRFKETMFLLLKEGFMYFQTC